jgi:phage portal protein BeeE
MADAPTRGGRAGAYVNQSAYQVEISYGNPNAPAPKPVEGADWFGPLQPIFPIAPPGVASRQTDYPSGYNLNTVSRVYKPVDFHTLRAMAENWDLLRLVIETRKDQAKRLHWSLQPKNRHTKKDVSEQTQRVTQFFKKPDGFHTFSEWLGMLLEDLFVIDAPAVYKQRNRGGKLTALYPIDGATLNPVIDSFGRTPLPYKQGGKTIYPVAYQQILKGYPAVDYSVRDLIYKPRNVRSNSFYGYSPTEQIIATVNLALRRQAFTTAYFTEGNIPDAIANVPDTWSPDQIKAYQKYWDVYFGGSEGARRKVKFMPGGTGANFHQTKEPDLKAEFDDWLSRVVCFAFSVSPNSLIKQTNRASGDTQKASAEEEGLVPIMAWVKELIDDVIDTELEAPDVEFIFGREDSVDESAKATILDGQVKLGIKSLNEARIEVGIDRIDNPAFDVPMIYTALGMIPVDANTIEGLKARAKISPPKPPGAPGIGVPKGTQGSPAATTPKVQTGPSMTARKGYEPEEEE